ncbi:MAG: metalloregulator ArsR/SmtB family transcription factor [bacterium]
MEEIYELQADICKIFSNAKRLEIINVLKDGERSANELIERTGLSKANLSQHMAVLRATGVVLARREGVNMYYCIANPKIIQACNLMKEVLAEQIQEKGRIISIHTSTSKKNPGSKSVKQQG